MLIGCVTPVDDHAVTVIAGQAAAARPQAAGQPGVLVAGAVGAYNAAMTLTRRSFVSGMLAAPLAASYSASARAASSMKITRIETVYWNTRDDAPFWPHWTWVKIDTDAGVSGIGETYPRNAVEAEVVHSIAPLLIGCDPRDIERIWGRPLSRLRFSDRRRCGRRRALSAVNLALWDLLGNCLNVPVHRSDWRQGQSASPLVQHLFSLQVRLQS